MLRTSGKTGGVLLALLISYSVTVQVALAQEAPQFTEEYMNDSTNIELGREIWVGQCALCHGAKSYPGKAPKLKPKRYKPEFVFKRITKGFRKMPAWEDVYSREERMALVAWVKNRKFSP